MKKPIIGITPLWDNEKESLWMLPGYQKGIEQAGGIPLILPLTDNPHILARILPLLDGLLFTGGQDINPSLYHQKPSASCGPSCPTRDHMETWLFQKGVLDQNLPALGICRGIQLINALLGGTLCQDIPSQLTSSLRHQQKPPYDQPAHTVSIIHNSPLHRLLGETELTVNSYHHQCIRQLSPKLTAMATAPDGIIEAIHMPTHPFVWAIQWHPEFTPEHPASQQLFKAFIKAAAEECFCRSSTGSANTCFRPLS